MACAKLFQFKLMRTFSQEDTMISPRPRATEFGPSGYGEEANENAGGVPMLDRCRALFRAWGERMTSFDLSRQIYG